MRHIFLPTLLAVSLSAPVAAQEPPAVTAPTQTVQQAFDEATNALTVGEWANAMQRFEALQPRVARTARTLAVVRIRLALALLELGRIDDARQAAERGLAALPGEDAALTADRFEALVLLGRIAEASLDYAAAASHYRAAAALGLPEQDKLIAYRGLIQVQLFDQPEAAVRAADTALAVISADAQRNRNLEGQFRTLKGRALLNLGRFREARQELETALRLIGNLTLRSDRADLVARGDLALAALLTRDEEGARRYLAYTGQGRFLRGHVPTGPHFIPQCGENLRPDDVAVIEFSISSNGFVGHVMPVYASRGPAALQFANAVSHWRFDPEAVGDIPLLLRTVVRVELRCTQSRFRGPEDDIPDVARFVHEQPLRSRAVLRAALTEAERGNASLPIVRALIALADHPATQKAEAEALTNRALTSAIAGNLDGRLIAGLAIRAAEPPSERGRDAAALEALAASAQLRGNIVATAAIRLVVASSLYTRNELDRALEIASAVAAIPEVQAHPELGAESAALLAAIRAQSGSAPASQSSNAECRIARPSRGTSANPNDFPTDALRWGFEGWAVIEPMVEPDGRVSSTRTIIAYPPYVFGNSAARVAQRGRYDRSGLAASCVGQRVRVRFLLPD